MNPREARSKHDAALHDLAHAWHGLPKGVQCNQSQIDAYVNRDAATIDAMTDLCERKAADGAEFWRRLAGSVRKARSLV